MSGRGWNEKTILFCNLSQWYCHTLCSLLLSLSLSLSLTHTHTHTHTHTTVRRTFWLQAMDEQEMQEWMNALTDCIVSLSPKEDKQSHTNDNTDGVESTQRSDTIRNRAHTDSVQIVNSNSRSGSDKSQSGSLSSSYMSLFASASGEIACRTKPNTDNWHAWMQSHLVRSSLLQAPVLGYQKQLSAKNKKNKSKNNNTKIKIKSNKWV